MKSLGCRRKQLAWYSDQLKYICAGETRKSRYYLHPTRIWLAHTSHTRSIRIIDLDWKDWGLI